MDNVKAPIQSQAQTVRLIAQADPLEFSLFLGAGASRSSGVVLASEMIRAWREMAFSEAGSPGGELVAWCKAKGWYESPTEYSDMFEALFPDERARQKYIESRVEAGSPGWGYLYLANIMREGRFNLVFTTNFDDLVNEALTRFYGYNPVVCAADTDVATINVSTQRPKIVKLHGDYLFKSLKNTREELARLTTNMERKFGEFARQFGMVVIGYHGADQSIMSMLAGLLADRDNFPRGIYWGVHDASRPLAEPLAQLVATYPTRLRLFQCEDFDVFMANLHEALKLPEPQLITQPLAAARVSLDRLLTQTAANAPSNGPTHTMMRTHAEHLAEQLRGSIAQMAAGASLDLFDAQIALGSRDHAGALQRVARHVAGHPNDPQALTIWGTALWIQSEEEGQPRLAEQAAIKWREAVRADPKWTGARYNLLRFHMQRQQIPEAIAEGEALLLLAPRDPSLRLTLVQLYGSAGRSRDALTLIDQLLVEDPDNPALHMTRAATLELRGRVVESLAAVQRALQLAPANPWVRIQSANGYARTGRPLEASAEFNQAIQLDPRNIGFRIAAAQFFLGANLTPQALPHLREAARLEPDAAEVRGWLATAHMNLGEWNDARREIEVALKLDANEPRLLGTAAQIYAMTNELPNAERCAQRAVELNPNAVGPYAMLAQVYARWQRSMELNQVLQRISQIDPMAARQLQQQFAQQFNPGFGQPQQPNTADPFAATARKFFDWLGDGKPR